MRIAVLQLQELQLAADMQTHSSETAKGWN
jgi:hypothetical protein